MEEIWKSIEGWESLYEVSNYGRVKSLSRISLRGNPKVEHKLKERVLKVFYNFHRRALVGLHRDGEGQTTLQVSRLVANAFMDNPNNFTDINHIDGNPANNRTDNLEWCTRSDNMKHAWSNGLITSERKYVSEFEVKKMRAYREAGCSAKLISEIFECSHFNTVNICNGKTRTDIVNDLEYIIG